MRRPLLSALLAPLTVLSVHCGGTPSGAAASPLAEDAGAIAEAGFADDASDALPALPTVQVTPGSGIDACAPGAADLPDDMGADTNCDGADGVVGTDVYVDPTLGLDTSAGTPTAPLRTVAAALALATSRSGAVLVTAGTIAGDTLSVAGTWSIFGGYGASFLGAPERATTVFTPSAAGLLIDQATSAKLAHVTIMAQAPTDPSQPSAHGLRSNVAKLALDDVDVEAADGAAGQSGTSGTDGQDPDTQSYPPTCGGSAEPQYALGAITGYASPDGTPAGNFSAETAAPQAGAGAAGSDGADASGALHLDKQLARGDQGASGQASSWYGYGGAPGGSGRVTSGPYANASAEGGDGGTGGCPGSGGTPAKSGGSSVALLVLSGEADLTRSTVHAGLGGTGGDGGAGGPGGHGSLGAPATAWDAGGHPIKITPSISPTCPNPASDVFQVNCAAYGGQGGEGGAGGRGGGGAGGWSVAILTAPAALYTVDAATRLAASKAGTGGLGNGGGWAPSGQALRTSTITP